MAALRVIAGLAMALFATAYGLIGMMFILGDMSLGDYRFAFGVFGMLGLCAPVVLCGIHLVGFMRARPVWAHAVMVSALLLSLMGAIFAMLPYLLTTPPQPEADNVVYGALVMAGLFGWPIWAGLVNALLARKD